MTAKISSKELIQLINRSGLRPSVHRLAVLEYVANKRTHPTSDEVFDALVEEFPKMSRTTVYNSLHALADSGLLTELPVDAGRTRYDFRPQLRHSHFICRQCGAITDMPYPAGLNPTASEGFVIDDVDVCYRGICPQCARRQTEEHNS